MQKTRTFRQAGQAALLLAALATVPWFGRAADAPSAPASTAAPIAAAAKPAAIQPRRLEEDELRPLLTAALTRQLGIDGAELELLFSRPWKPVQVPDGQLTVEILEPSTARLASTCFVRFELHADKQTVGSWLVPMQARLWRDVLVARSALQRGQPLQESDFALERRDLLTVHDALAAMPARAALSELAENLAPGAPLTARAIRLRPVVFRGQTADAVVRDGAMMVSLKVEVLEEGVPGQMIRVRNIQSRRELRGKVEDDQTITIPL